MMRTGNNANEIASCEFAAALASDCLLDAIVESDISEANSVQRDATKVLARRTAQEALLVRVAAEMLQGETPTSDKIVTSYIASLRRIFVKRTFPHVR